MRIEMLSFHGFCYHQPLPFSQPGVYTHHSDFNSSTERTDLITLGVRSNVPKCKCTFIERGHLGTWALYEQRSSE